MLSMCCWVGVYDQGKQDFVKKSANGICNGGFKQ